jgi:hypothetical protein
LSRIGRGSPQIIRGGGVSRPRPEELWYVILLEQDLAEGGNAGGSEKSSNSESLFRRYPFDIDHHQVVLPLPQFR